MPARSPAERLAEWRIAATQGIAKSRNRACRYLCSSVLFLIRKMERVHKYIMETNLLLLGDVARLLGCRPHQIVYLLTSGHVPEPPLRIGNRRMFTQHDVDRIAVKLGLELERSTK